MHMRSRASLLALIPLLSSCGVEVGYGSDGPQPQHVARLHAPVEGCETGPLSFMIANETDTHLRLTLDGVGIEFLDDGGSYDVLAPGLHGFICLDDSGAHSVTGRAYAERYGRLVAIEGDDGSFVWNGRFGTATHSSGRHELAVTQALLILN